MHYRAVLVLLAFASMGCPSKTVCEVVTEYGYTCVRPASRLPQPGAVVAIVSTQPLQLEIICDAGESIGSEAKLTKSPAPETEYLDRKSANLDAEFESALKASYKGLRSVKVSLANASVTSLTIAEYAKQAEAHRTPTCLAQMKKYRDAGRKLTVIYEALEADVTYSLEYDQDVTATTQGTVATALGGKLGATASSTDATKLTGTALFWGVREDGLMASPQAGVESAEHQPLLPVSAASFVEASP